MEHWLEPGIALPAWTGPALVGLSVLSALGLLAAAVALPRVLAELPVDYLQTPEAPIVHRGRRLLRGLLAGVLALAGLAMLVLPGQGVLTLLAAAIVSPVRGKKRLVQWIVGWDVVLGGVNALRARRGAPPLVRGSAPTAASPSARTASGPRDDGEGATPTRTAPGARGR